MHVKKNWIAVALMLLSSPASIATAQTPDIGSKAPDFTLSMPDGQAVRLSELASRGKVVLIVLRGYPGYQCPYWTKLALVACSDWGFWCKLCQSG